MAELKTTRWDPAKHLVTTADIAAYLDAAIEDGDPALISAAPVPRAWRSWPRRSV